MSLNMMLLVLLTHLLRNLKRAFFRHDRRTAPKFGTHVRIETRLALTKKLTHPRGVIYCVARMFVGCLWDDVCGCQLRLTYLFRGPVTLST